MKTLFCYKVEAEDMQAEKEKVRETNISWITLEENVFFANFVLEIESIAV